MTPPRLPVALTAVSAGAVLGSLARYGIGDAADVGVGFPWDVFTINVVGSALLAALPLLAVVRRRAWLAMFLGTGVLGGFTTMSAASEQTVFLFEHDRAATALVYLVGTLVTAVLAVRLVASLTPTGLGDLDAAEADR